MLRLKYYSLTKEEKRKLTINFYNTEFGKNIKLRLDRLLVIGILGILFSIYLYITSINKWNIIYATILLLTSLFFILASHKVRIKKLNDYLVKAKKK